MVSLTSSHLQLRQAAVGAPLSYLLVVRSLSCTSLPQFLLLPDINGDRFADTNFFSVLYMHGWWCRATLDIERCRKSGECTSGSDS